MPTETNEVEVQADATLAKFMQRALDRFQRAAEAESHTRSEALDDLKFRAGNQWPEDIKNARANKPCLTMDRTEQFVRLVCNEERQQRPSIQVNPVGDDADVDTAEIEQGLIRHIEVQSHADMARDHAFELMVSIGFGYYRLLIEEDELTGDLEIYQKRIKNPFTVYFVPPYQDPVYADSKACFIIEDIRREDYEEEYPDSALASLLDFQSIGDDSPDWVTDDYIRVAEYFYVEGEGKSRKVKWAKINAVECLEGGPGKEIIWAGKWIPIIPVLGTDLDVDGQRYLAGLIRKLKDPQRQYNYMSSAMTQTIALSPLAPWVAYEGQLEGHEEQWRLANVRNDAALIHKQVVGPNGQLLPPPSREVLEPPIQAVMEAMHTAANDLQSAAGIIDPSQGSAQPSDHSGKAILARQKQGDLANLNWTDNLSRSMWFEGRQLLDLIPKVYTENKVRRIIKPDGTVQSVAIINEKAEKAQSAAKEFEGIDKIYNIGVGSYDVTISVGPSYQTKRQEAVVSQMAFMEAVPQAAPFISDIVAGNSDWPGSKEIAERLRKMLPPALQEQDGSPEGQLQQAQGQLQQMHGIIQQQGQLLQQQHDIVQGKILENQTKKEIEFARIQADLAGKKLQYETQLAVAQINASKDTNEAIARQELEQFGMIHDAAHETALQHHQHAHDEQMAEQQAAVAQQSQAADQQHQVGMAQQAQEAQQSEAAPTQTGV